MLAIMKLEPLKSQNLLLSRSKKKEILNTLLYIRDTKIVRQKQHGAIDTLS